MESLWGKIVYGIVMALASAAIGLLIAFLKQKLGIVKMQETSEALKNKEGFARLAVLFAQQVYWSLDGPARFEKAASSLSKALCKAGIIVTADELKELIEAALKALKKEFGDAWDGAATGIETAKLLTGTIEIPVALNEETDEK